jgi:hypothetical protein
MTLPQIVETCASCGATGHPVQELGDDLQLRTRCGQCGAIADGPKPAPVIPLRPNQPAPPPAATTSTELLALAESRLTDIERALAEHNAMKSEAKQLRRMIAALRRR